MAIEASLPVEERIIQMLRHLGIEKAHFAACMPRDWGGFVTSYPDVVSSLTLICPIGMNLSALRPNAPRLLVISGDQGRPAAEIRRAMANLPDATSIILRDYYSPMWADVIADYTGEIGSGLLTFLKGIDRRQGDKDVMLSEGEGEIGEITYSVRGSGHPLVLLPLALAPSQWQPLLPQLNEHYCTITLGGPALGIVAFLEARARGYLRVVRSLVDEAGLRAGETVLEVGCGSGVVVRWLARHTHGANRIVGVDINSYLLREAATLVRKEGLESPIEFQEGNAEALPFRDSLFDVTMACTVLEEGNADRILAEMVRVTKPGGRVVVIVRSIDMPGWVNLPLRPKLKRKAETQGGSVEKQGCADAGLYRRMHQAGLIEVTKIPQWASYSEGERLQDRQERILANLSPEEWKEWQVAVDQASADGSFFIAQPFHCTVGTKP